jgi:hypothetical protein
MGQSLGTVFLIYVFVLSWITMLTGSIAGMHCQKTDWAKDGLPLSCQVSWVALSPLRPLTQFQKPKVGSGILVLARGIWQAERGHPVAASRLFDQAITIAQIDSRRLDATNGEVSHSLAQMMVRMNNAGFAAATATLWQERLIAELPNFVSETDETDSS